jgi:hypothetical protein
MSNKNLREGREVIFVDGSKKVVYPLTLRQLRKFMKVVAGLNDGTSNDGMTDEDITRMVEATAIVLEKVDPELSADLDAIEDNIDIKIFNQIIAGAMGADPNA